MMVKTSFVASLDLYRKVPGDFLEGTRRGSVLSWVALSVMATLFALETRDFLRTTLVSELSLDKNRDKKLRVNFNVTMMDLSCHYATVDVVSVYGTNQNVTQHITKHHVDAEGVRRGYARRNRKQHDLAMFDETVTETIEELTREGEDALTLEDPAAFEAAKGSYQFLFVDYYAMWCSHCRALMPTWETLAKLMSSAAKEIVDVKSGDAAGDLTAEEYEHAVNLELPVRIAKIDCVENHAFCMEQNIQGYPSLRLFVDGEKYGADYHGDRTVLAFTDYLATVEEQYLKTKGNLDFADSVARREREGAYSEGDMDENSRYRETPDRPRRKMRREWLEEEHPGCEIYGHLTLDRVPGNFHIEARSLTHDIAPAMTNVSHEVNHLSFGDPYARRRLESGAVKDVPTSLAKKTVPMDGNVYVTRDLHEAHHHYLKLISTYYDDPRGYSGPVYQIMPSSQLTYYKTGVPPEAKFQFDLSPISVTYKRRSRKWYDYLTSIMAIVGGTFTVFGMIENSLQFADKKRKKLHLG